MPSIHVSAAGDDRRDGGRQRPVATLQRAVELTRMRPSGAAARIVMHAGTYDETHVELDPRDSGLTIEAAGEGPVVLRGGRTISGWTDDGDGMVAAPLAGVTERTWDFRLLIVAGQSMPRARLPREGVFTHDSVFDVPWMSTTKGGWQRKPTEQELTQLCYRGDDLGDWLDVSNAEITVYHQWDESMVPLRSIDSEQRLLTFADPAGHPPGAFASYQPRARTYIVWNVRQGMHEPGQWYLDRTRGKVVYCPLPGQVMDGVEVLAPTVESIIVLAGEEARPVTGITLRGLTLEATTTPCKAGGFGAGAFAGAIHGEQIHDLSIEDVEVRRVGGQGVKLNHCRDVKLHRLHVHETGAAGIVANGLRIEIADCHVHHVGRTYPSAMAVRCSGQDCRVLHNHIHHTPYSAVISGGEGHLFERNRFQHVMEQLDDGAAIYVFAGIRCIIRGNHTSDVRDATAHAYYLDERSEDSIVEDNLSQHCAWPLHNHMASRCILRRNVCMHDGPMKLTLHSCHDFEIEGNVFVCRDHLSVESSYTGLAKLERNVIDLAGSANLTFSYHDRLPSLETNPRPAPLPQPMMVDTVLAPVRFVDAEHGDWRHEPGTEAARLGLATLDVCNVGPRSR
jgi:hypothetical protein